MIGILSIIAVGFFLGMRHATDPDHVIAVGTIISQQRSAKRAAWIGVFWGLGHTITISMVGGAIILFNIVIPARLGLAMELSVGVMLIMLGAWNLASFMRAMPQPGGQAEFPLTPDSRPHRHGDYVHTHPHSRDPESHPHNPEQTPLAKLDKALGRAGFYRAARPLVVGIVHGLAGSAAVALLILATIRNTTWAIVYLLVFGVGTIAGMMLITMSIASAFRVVENRFHAFGRRLAFVSGLISVAFGMVLAYEICVVKGLFAGSPHWIPR